MYLVWQVTVLATDDVNVQPDDVPAQAEPEKPMPETDANPWDNFEMGKGPLDDFDMEEMTPRWGGVIVIM